jgi:hypothetical protein
MSLTQQWIVIALLVLVAPVEVWRFAVCLARWEHEDQVKRVEGL